MPRPKGANGTWEENNRRVIFYCPKDVEAQIEAAMAASDRSKTQVIVDALRAQLGKSTDGPVSTKAAGR